MQPVQFSSSAVALEDVCIICSSLPSSSSRHELPVRVASADQCPAGLENVYLCGTVEEVWPLRVRFRPLGCFVDRTDSDCAELPNCQVLPQLAEGLALAWEPLLAAVCSRHVATIQDMILRNARRWPDKLALIYEDREWTYQQMCSAACSLRDRLLEGGLCPSRGPIAVRIDASDYSAICFLALMSGRFTVHLLDRGASSQRYRLQTCPSQAIVTKHGQDLAVTEDLRVFNLDEMQLDWSQPLSSLHMDGDLNDVAFIEYTSGSTGNPKSVATVQWRIAHWARWHLFHFPPQGARDAYNLFWIWYWQIPLTTGSTCVVWPNWQSQDISQLMQYFRRHRVTRCNCLTPGQLSALLSVEDTLPNDLQEVFVGGEALPLSTCRSWLKKWPHVRLVVNYATTETAADMAFLPMTEEIACMDMPFAPLSANIVCWNNQMTIENEELVISGWNVADGYLPPTVSSAFRRNEDGFTNTYRTGDRAQIKDGHIFIMGRVDKVVKVRGFRVDTDGLESLLMKETVVKDVCVRKFKESLYAVTCTTDIERVKTFAKENYEHSNLIVWVPVDGLPITKSGKKDIRAIEQILSDLENTDEVMEYDTEEERRVAAAYKEVLGRQVSRDTPFLEAGGHSLSAMRIAKLLGISPVELFKYPTIADLAKFLSKDVQLDKSMMHTVSLPRVQQASNGPLAVVGMACRLPNADSAEHFWDSLKAGHLMTTQLPVMPGQIPRKGVVPDHGFDCHFWKCSEQAAAMMDTAQRTLLEVSYEAFHGAGFSARLPDGQLRGLELPERNVAVIVCGGSLNHWPIELGVDLEESRTKRPDEYFNLEVGTDKDYLASTIAYRLDLHGTAEVVQTACSSALVAISRSVQLLKSGYCDYALCGGASFSPNAPIAAVDGLIWSPDGVCRPYAEGANGTTNSDGGGVVILSRLSTAVSHGNVAHAHVLGSATNNDGARKSTFSAPSYEGQVEVLRQAHLDAGILSSQLDYVEGHGTGTKLGDPLEIAALTEVLGQEGRIVLGSVKGNLGHLNTAAGVPGLLKAVLMLKHQSMVPSLHAVNPSKEVDWNRTPLTLATLSESWQGSLASVSSFGVGGTNAHVVLKAAAQNGHASPEKVSWNRKPVEVLLSSFNKQTKHGNRQVQAVAQTPVKMEARKSLEDWFYEATREAVRLSELKPKLAAVLLDGEEPSMPEGMPKTTVLTTWQRAVPAAKAAGGFLIFLGTSTLEPDVNDTSQEVLLLNFMTLIKKLTQSKSTFEVAFILQNTLRYAGLLGFLRSAMKEHPELRLRLLCREGEAPVLFPAAPGEFILTTQGVFTPRLRSVPSPAAVGSFAMYERALVTGGLRGLGLRVAKWLADTGRAKSLVLMGRNQSQGSNAELLEELSRQLPVEVRLGDVSKWEEVQSLPDVDLVVHCAGAVKDGVLLKLTREDVRKVIYPKIRGSLHLRKKFPNAKKLAFSSSSGLLGVPGQSTYAAGNTFVDAVMPSIQWGGWAETGMVEDLGIEPLPGEHFVPVNDGLECFGRILDAEERAVPLAVLDVHWPVFRQQKTVFAPDDALLATIEVEIPRPSPDQLKQVWTLGAAGSRHRGSRQSLELCQQHMVSGVPVLPGSALLALALEVSSQVLQTDSVQLQDVKFIMPLELQSVRQLTLTVTKSASGGALRFSSRADGNEDSKEALHCTANFTSAEVVQRPRMQATQAHGPTSLPLLDISTDPISKVWSSVITVPSCCDVWFDLVWMVEVCALTGRILKLAQIMSVDLGHEFFKVALMRQGMPLEIVLNSHSKRKTTTAVSFFEASRVFGDDALAHISKAPTKVPTFFHSLLGQNFTSEADVQSGGPWWKKFGLSDLFYKFDLGYDVERGVPTFKVGEDEAHLLQGEEILASILSFAKQMSEDSADGKSVRELVVTVPSDATLRQRQAIVSAGEIAGLRVLTLVHETSAFAVQRAVDVTPDKGASDIHLFYNLGSRKAEVSIVRFESRSAGMVAGKMAPVLTVLGSAIDYSIGGHLMDLRIAEKMLKKFQEKFPKFKDGVITNSRALRKILSQAQKTKMVLSSNKVAPFNVESLYEDTDFQATLSREDFESMCQDMFDALSRPIDKALAAANVTMADIKFVEVVGGAWRVPKVQQILSSHFKSGESSLPLGQHLNGEEAGAMGAALVAANSSSSFRVKKIFFSDISAHEYAVQVTGLDGTWEKNLTVLYPVGSALGSKKKLSFTMEEDFKVKVFENTILVSEYSVTGLKDLLENKWKPYNTTGPPKISVSVPLETSGIVEVKQPMATIEELYWVNVTKEKPKANASKSKNATEESNASEASNETEENKDEKKEEKTDEKEESNDSNATEEPEVVLKQKKKKHEKKLTVKRLDYLPKPLTDEKIEELQKRLKALKEHEEEAAAMAGLRNELEAYIYGSRDKMERDDIVKVSTEQQREGVSKLCTEYEDWIHEAGHHPKSEFETKLKALQDLLSPMEERALEMESRADLPDTVTEEMETIKEMKKHVLKNMTWVSSNKTDAAAEKLTEFESWWEKKQEQQKKIPLHEAPAYTKQEVLSQISKVKKEWEKLKKIKKPKETKPKKDKNTSKSEKSEKEDPLPTDIDAIERELSEISVKKMEAVEKEDFDAAHALKQREQLLSEQRKKLKAEDDKGEL
ncbi:unnamed protein product [Cladocopium goreaui]|uniref:Polyketide synthase PksN n=1 Tax=Cladocopium goreaui TaxID=2562237 RepID=A0A9P1BYL8_9DINO|nr:unnamed protein product [Cladocopium goreaui]